MASRPANMMDGATADHIPPVFAWVWACCSPPYFVKRDPHYHNQDARTESSVRDESRILVSAAHVERTQIHVSARRGYNVPTPSWWSVVEVPHKFTARMPRVVAYFCTALRREESTPATTILDIQWVREVEGVWSASA